MDQSSPDGTASVISTALNEKDRAVEVTYSGGGDPGAWDAEPASSQGTSVGDQPFLVFAGNAVLDVQGNGVQIWDYAISGGTNPSDPIDVAKDLPWLAPMILIVTAATTRTSTRTSRER